MTVAESADHDDHHPGAAAWGAGRPRTDDARRARTGARRSPGEGGRRGGQPARTCMQRQGKLPAAARRIRCAGPRVVGAIVAGRPRASRGGAPAIASAALVAGGGYAEYRVAPEPQCLPVPRRARRWTKPRRCRRPSSRCGPTCSSAAGCGAGETLLVHGGCERHRHDGHPTGARARRARVRDGRHRGEMPRRARRSARSAPSTIATRTSSPVAQGRRPTDAAST